METDDTHTGTVYSQSKFKKKLNRFDDLIRYITFRDSEATVDQRRKWISENLRFNQFSKEVRKLFGSDVETQDINYIYQQICTDPDTKVDWTELFGCYNISGSEEKSQCDEYQPIFLLNKRKRIGERKTRDTVQCLKYIQDLDCYICCSQKGVLSVWTGQLRFQSSVDIHEPSWVTGCDYLPGLRRIGCCTERSIALWDSRATENSQNVFVLKPIENSPQCMASVAYNSSEPEDQILFGDDQGYVNLLTISAKDLIITDSKGDSRRSKSGNYVIQPRNMSSPVIRRKLHDGIVVKVRYFPELHSFASCSPSTMTSFVLDNVDRVFNHNEVARTVSIPKGVNCFELCAGANVIATGGLDKIVRLWNPHVLYRPTGKLVGHLFTIIDIAVNETDNHVISMCAGRVFRVWDIHTLTCLQVFADYEGKPGVRRINSMIFDNTNERLLAGSSVIETWPLSRAVQETVPGPLTPGRTIVHRPVPSVKTKSASLKVKTAQSFEYPLIFDKGRWEPFRRSAYNSRKGQVQRPENHKYFGALIKPKAYNYHLKNCFADNKTNWTVFRSLPVYRICTPTIMRTPEFNFPIPDIDDEDEADSRMCQ